MADEANGDGPHDIIVMGASAGGVEALLRLAAGLPADLPAAVCVVVHVTPSARSVLPELLSRAGPLPAAYARDGEPLCRGRIYVAPPDRHLLVEDGGVVRLSAGPRENHARPAADPLFRSAATAFGPRVVGVVLSGALSDGAAGLWEVKQHGGVAVVQDPGEAAFPSMPHHAMDEVPVDHVLPVADMPALLARLAGPGAEQQEGKVMATQKPNDESPGTDAVKRDTAQQIAGGRDGTVTVYVCPDCGGSLWQANAGPFTRFRCHVGHAYGAEDLLEGYTADMERELWRVVRSLRDKANLTRQLAKVARDRGDTENAARYERRALLDEEHAGAIEKMIAATESANRPA